AYGQKLYCSTRTHFGQIVKLLDTPRNTTSDFFWQLRIQRKFIINTLKNKFPKSAKRVII
ncbi:MAG: hypothetical protein Q8L57_02720, partial [bacterium]|nr:hypothetical protein [bacterium]